MVTEKGLSKDFMTMILNDIIMFKEFTHNSSFSKINVRNDLQAYFTDNQERLNLETTFVL